MLRLSTPPLIAHETDFLGLLVSPLMVYVGIALVGTLAIGLVADRLLARSLGRNEGLLSVLVFLSLLGLCMRSAF